MMIFPFGSYWTAAIKIPAKLPKNLAISCLEFLSMGSHKPNNSKKYSYVQYHITSTIIYSRAQNSTYGYYISPM